MSNPKGSKLKVLYAIAVMVTITLVGASLMRISQTRERRSKEGFWRPVESHVEKSLDGRGYALPEALAYDIAYSLPMGMFCHLVAVFNCIVRVCQRRWRDGITWLWSIPIVATITLLLHLWLPG
jgi:hypothetical protein